MASTSLRAQRTEPVNWLLLAAFVVGVVAAGALVGVANSPGSWYESLDKPPANPPSGVFGPVWTVLYAAIGAAGYLAWRATSGAARTTAMVAWSAQLALNLAWTPIFFGLERPGWALVEIVVMLVAIVATIVIFARSSRPAAALLVPYLAWVCFATYLTAGIVLLN
jgi:tryptophan-rich sensory protein